MSMYAEYLRERTDDEIVEREDGFATFRYVEEGRAVYIVDIYTKPESRKKHVAASMADEIAKIAKDKGCTSLIGTVQLSAKTCASSLQALLAYGLKPQSTGSDFIILRKEI